MRRYLHTARAFYAALPARYPWWFATAVAGGIALLGLALRVADPAHTLRYAGGTLLVFGMLGQGRRWRRRLGGIPEQSGDGMADRVRGRWQPLVETFLAVGAGLLLGLLLHVAIVVLRDHGPSGAGWSLRGNGATILLPLVPVVMLVGLLVCVRRRVWWGIVLFPLAVYLGVFWLAGGV